MTLEDIGFYTLSDYRVSHASFNSPLWRCEIILTENCNFKCSYCRGLREDCKEELSLDYAKRVINYWGDEGLKNIRFSGGEPTMFKGLLELVRLSKHRRIERIAISTNGSASLSYYNELVDAGVDDFSISLDACCGTFGDEIAGIKGSWDKVTKNIEALSQKSYITVGVVITESNVYQAADIIRFAHRLGVADIRVIPSAQYNQHINAMAEIESEVIEAHPILKYRIENHLRGCAVRGLTPKDNHRCPLVLDDMAVAGNYHFPCVIYMREQGNPIGNMNDLKSIRRDRYLWFKKHDTYADPICKKNCLDVCIEYNNRFDNDRLLDRKNEPR